MPPAYEVLLLNTAVPQIQAAQSGDTYVVPRDIAFSAALTLSAGTANGVAYLNGSKVLTTGSALTFDGSTLATAGKFGITGNGSTPTASALQIGTNGVGSRWLYNVPTGGEHNFTENGTVLSWQNLSSLGWLIGGSEQMRLTSTGLKVGTTSDFSGAKVVTDGGGIGILNKGLLRSSTNGVLQVSADPNNAYASSQISFDIDGNTLATLDSSGRLLVGVTVNPGGGNLEVISNGVSAFTARSTSLGASTTVKAVRSVSADASAFANAQYDALSHGWILSNGSQAMTLDASGNLLVGGTSNALSARALLENASGNQIGLRYTGVATYYNSVDSSGNLVWTKDGSERARITSGGYFKASNAGTYQDAGGTYHELRSSASDVNTVFVANTSASPYGQVIKFSSASPDNNTNWFFICEDSTTTRLYIYSDGDLANHDGVYGTISDQKLKQDIVDAGSQWDDIKAIRFRKYRMKSDVAVNPDAPALLGVVAQELEQVSPGLVDEHPDMETVEVTDEDGNVTQTQQPTGTTTKTVKSSILLMKAAVALQEAMARIETLEAEVAALKGA